MRVSAEEFVRVWQSSGSVDEVVERLSANRMAIYQHYSRLRRRGVPLKKMKEARGRKPLDIAHLTKVAKASLRGGK